MPYHIHNSQKPIASSLEYLSNMIEGLKQVLQAPLINLLFIFIIAFIWLLPLGTYLVWKNADVINNALSHSAKISLYLKKHITTQRANDLAEQLKSNAAIMEVSLISSEDGMKDFVRRTEFGEILLGFKENPLPNVIIVSPKLNELSSDQVIKMLGDFKNIVGVETVKTDVDWLKISYQLLNLFRYLMGVLIVLSISFILIFCSIAYITPQVIIRKRGHKLSPKILQYQCLWHSVFGIMLALLFINFMLMRLRTLGLVVQGMGAGCVLGFMLLIVVLSFIDVKLAMRNRYSNNSET